MESVEPVVVVQALDKLKDAIVRHPLCRVGFHTLRTTKSQMLIIYRVSELTSD